MKVFISWSGDVSRALAVEMRDLLPMFAHHVDPWISARDIQPGERWAQLLGRELEECKFAIICLTRDNRQAPWLLFEAGAAARFLEARVVPLLFGVAQSDLDGPLAQFQSVQADRFGIESLVNTLLGDSRLNEVQRRASFERLWPLLEGRIKALEEQVKGNFKVESATDILADLATSAERGPDPILKISDWERLKQEEGRLRQELEYLEKEDEKLTQQDAPITMDRYIEPIQNRLAEVESTLRMQLDRLFLQLTGSQVGILRRLVLAGGKWTIWGLSAEQKADLKNLEQLGLVTMGQYGVAVTHDLVAAYVSERFGKA
jgi:hypothetical protein